MQSNTIRHTPHVRIMRQTNPVPVTETIDCAVCLQEIPSSEAQSSEARDYVAGFCGLACYAQWQALGDKASTDAADTGKPVTQ